ncbi:hypothetical protein MBCUT_10380 [Methanobrevibacter cuticularis]|uniref:Right handed beta helix domain-containing protein n=1 Tax=Methanobrevibacter cuticularis TaxID=47311 RepID=A0A166E1G2_9EURY|nr:right-handed parallel beta-helix repeat-containing protein [Methanobrevibacter cuticularis]KZX16172.1 hypothetical protein MBCUT_10380 [Methanobrevibacter cuticularis]
MGLLKFKDLSSIFLIVLMLVIAIGAIVSVNSVDAVAISNDTTIKEGIDSTANGGTLELGVGTWKGSIDGNRNNTIDKNLTIKGQGRDKTVIDLEKQGYAFNVNSGIKLTLVNLTIKNAGKYKYSGYDLVDGESNPVTNHGTLIISGSSFTGNIADHKGVISNFGVCTISSSSFTSHEGIRLNVIVNSGTLIISGSSFTGNNGWDGIISNSGSCTISGSSFSNNGRDGVISNSGSCTISGSSFSNNGMYRIISNYGVCTISGSSFSNNGNVINNLDDGTCIVKNSKINSVSLSFDKNSQVFNNVIVAAISSSGAKFDNNTITLKGWFSAGNSNITNNKIYCNGNTVALGTSIVSGNTISGGSPGISIRGSNNQIINNKIINCTNGIEIGGTTNYIGSKKIKILYSNNIIKNNRIINSVGKGVAPFNMGYGIFINAVVKNTKVINNYFENNQFAAYRDLGKNNKFSKNHYKNNGLRNRLKIVSIKKVKISSSRYYYNVKVKNYGKYHASGTINVYVGDKLIAESGFFRPLIKGKTIYFRTGWMKASYAKKYAKSIKTFKINEGTELYSYKKKR